jgi:hypothetical protein
MRWRMGFGVYREVRTRQKAVLKGAFAVSWARRCLAGVGLNIEAIAKGMKKSV